VTDEPTTPEPEPEGVPDIEPIEPIEPVPDIEPLEPFTADEIVRYARGVITQQYMLADARDHDWAMSLTLLLCAWKSVPENCSSLFLVPMAAHQNGRWLNGRVPGVTVSAVPVPMENVVALIAKCDEFYALLHPEPVDG
jgi:hypothetical protein